MAPKAKAKASFALLQDSDSEKSGSSEDESSPVAAPQQASAAEKSVAKEVAPEKNQSAGKAGKESVQKAPRPQQEADVPVVVGPGRKATGKVMAHRKDVAALAYASNHAVAIATDFDGWVTAWNLEYGEKVWEEQSQGVADVVVHVPELKAVFCAASDGSSHWVRRYDETSGKVLAEKEFDSSVVALTYAADVKAMAAGIQNGIEFWGDQLEAFTTKETKKGKAKAKPKANAGPPKLTHSAEVLSLAYGDVPGAAPTLFSSDKGGFIKAWNIASSKTQWEERQEEGCYSGQVVYARQLKQVITADSRVGKKANATVTFWSAAKGEKVKQIVVGRGLFDGMCYAPEVDQVICITQQQITVWDVKGTENSKPKAALFNKGEAPKAVTYAAEFQAAVHNITGGCKVWNFTEAAPLAKESDAIQQPSGKPAAGRGGYAGDPVPQYASEEPMKEKVPAAAKSAPKPKGQPKQKAAAKPKAGVKNAFSMLADSSSDDDDDDDN